MDLKGLVDKAKGALQKNPNLIDKGGDMVDKATGGKYADKVDKAQDATRKHVGAEGQQGEQPPQEGDQGQQPPQGGQPGQ